MKKIIITSLFALFVIGYTVYQKFFNAPLHTQVTASTIIPTLTATPTETPTDSPTQTQIQTRSNHPSSPTLAPSNTPTPTTQPQGMYKDGTYTGDTTDAFYGNIQVQATISNGKLTNIQFLQYPNDRDRSIAINQQADPILAQEAIQAQSAQVDVVSGATDSSQAFIQSLQSALNNAKS